MTRKIIWWLILVFQFLILGILIKGLPLNEFISHYEGVNYDRAELNDARHRAKRSLLQTISLDLHAFGRSLQLRLRPDSTIFSESPVIETSNGVWGYDQSNIYTGHLQDQENSKIHGTLTADNFFEGKILTLNETFILEPSSRYFINKPDFHTVIYKASHVNVAKFRNTNIDKLRNVLKNRSRVHRHVQNHYTRQRRSTVKNTCELYIKADYDFYEKYGGFSTDLVINQIVQYVQTVNSIYSVIDFDKDGSSDNIRFVIKRIKVYTNITDSNYIRYIGNFDVAKFLEIHSEENYDQFCLSYILTHRDFGDGVLGLAWTASLDENTAGGVCEKYLEINGVYRSLNTGFVTTLNYGQTVPNIVCHLTLAHEIGHNMGSEHDPENITCTPGGSSGNYLMYPKATTGEENNNLKFSPCSISQMGPIIQTRGSSSVGCFKDSSQSNCGNKVVEPGEECDCGWEDECAETCCNPQYSNNNIPATPCTLKPNATCSPSQGSCCSSSCQLITLSDNYVCQQNTSCQMKSVLNQTG
ncbi:disintegrin and metalloproteinase domain-containing protein 10 [Patella vulgata]|uniref:disintegrin and metalloproteinase domain-containing protein 10 n=1 Tax=Patella vulgata TaxID=6465 RepID=UPI0024A8F4AB|nr:disintegrin and metalloproteinase domain-containing protein 10 [Patella vulgata]